MRKNTTPFQLAVMKHNGNMKDKDISALIVKLKDKIKEKDTLNTDELMMHADIRKLYKQIIEKQKEKYGQSSFTLRETLMTMNN